MNLIEVCETIILHKAFKLGNILIDFIDRLILSSVINQYDARMTGDIDMQKSNKTKP